MNYKKLLTFLFLIVCILPFAVDAKACKVISGTGKDLGDEIACGSEHFYVLENEDGKIRMITKYNLYVGDKIDKGSDYFTDEGEAASYCESLVSTYGEGNVDLMAKFSPDGDPEKYFCRVFTPLVYDEVKQNEIAKGLYPTGNMEVAYPIYGNVYFSEEDTTADEFDENLDLIPEKSQFKEYFAGYKETLTKLGVTVLDMEFIKRSGIQDIINEVGTEKIEIPTDLDYFESEDPLKPAWEDGIYWDYLLFTSKVNIKEYIPEKYNWLYGTSYWSGSATKDDDVYYDEFLTTIGDYCSYERGCEIVNIGLGLRPVVTISENDIEVTNPNTGDNIACYIAISLISILGLSIGYCKLSKNN